MLFLVEARRTYEWGGYYEANTAAEAEALAKVEMSFDNADNILDEQVISKPVFED